MSPYHFVGNNPIYNIEVGGRYFTGNTSSDKAVALLLLSKMLNIKLF